MNDYKINNMMNAKLYDAWKRHLSQHGYRIFGRGSELRLINQCIMEWAITQALQNPEMCKQIMER